MPEPALCLLWGIERVLRPLGWTLRSIKGGYNSFVLEKPGDPREFHFRWWKETHPDSVMVIDGYRNGQLLGELTSVGDVGRFLVMVSRTKKRWY
jgi:hypothetical protein